jgi:hypothetical protein
MTSNLKTPFDTVLLSVLGSVKALYLRIPTGGQYISPSHPSVKRKLVHILVDKNLCPLLRLVWYLLGPTMFLNFVLLMREIRVHQRTANIASLDSYVIG